MDPVEKVLGRLRGMEEVFDVLVPSDEDLKTFFELEAAMQTSSGMPMINLSLEEAMKRRHHLCIFQKSIIDRVPHHNMTMVDANGNTVGFDVPDDLRYEVEGRDDLVWLSDDFVMDPNICSGEVSIVLHPYPITLFDDDPDVNDMILMFPATPVDDLIRSRYGVPQVRDYNSAILSFN